MSATATDNHVAPDPEAVTSAACIPCRERGRDTAVQWQGPLNEQAIRDMGEHLREHDPWATGVHVTINDDTWTFDLNRED